MADSNERPILKSWADMAAASIPPTVRNVERNTYETMFYGGATAVLNDVVKILESGDLRELVEYIERGKADVEAHTRERMAEYGFTEAQLLEAGS